jgi:hypothetical protein
VVCRLGCGGKVSAFVYLFKPMTRTAVVPAQLSFAPVRIYGNLVFLAFGC